MIEVFGHQVNPGEKAYFTVPVGQLSHQAVIEIPVIVVAGKKEGTVLWVNGTVHGDELNGFYAAWELSRELDPEKLSGTFIVTPICNPIAFEARNKISAIDSMDMDTAFPGDPKGMLDGTVVQPQKQILITKRKFLRSDKGGLIQMCVKSGDTVKAGEALLKLHYYGSEVSEMPAETDCFVIGTERIRL